jgi:hypothetical protein
MLIIHEEDLKMTLFRRLLAVTGSGDYGLVALATGSPLHTHGRVDDNGVMLCLSSGIASTGRDVTGDDIRLTKARPVSGSFRLRVARGN